ncbi:TroA family protein [Pyrobaculum calidifontis]|uniref:Fe/B12 periplasmic-binding domain-containing protein n=1 Tax=Pyrobaculum calidifontis (strain DSM 21063 / JCM 11548 / VA1) TaxID=410359 RepID=A3MSC4_PYRCJ|nr:conserved hypothetical protein [Pyrobaculum calidifontis JCM 11548]
MAVILRGEVDGVPKRVVSLNPSVNEFLALLGVELAGRDAFTYRPRELMKAPIVGTFVDMNFDAVKRMGPDLVILYHPVQTHLLDKAATAANAVVAVPTPTSVDHVAAIFRFFARLFDKDEQGDWIAGVYKDLLRGPPILEGVVAVINLGVYDLACRNSYLADALTAAGLKYAKTPPCVFKHSQDPPKELHEANFVIYEARGKALAPAEHQLLKSRPHVATPNDTLAHYGPSLPLDIRNVAQAAVKGQTWVGETSSTQRPSLRDPWYRPYL